MHINSIEDYKTSVSLFRHSLRFCNNYGSLWMFYKSFYLIWRKQQHQMLSCDKWNNPLKAFIYLLLMQNTLFPKNSQLDSCMLLTMLINQIWGFNILSIRKQCKQLLCFLFWPYSIASFATDCIKTPNFTQWIYARFWGWYNWYSSKVKSQRLTGQVLPSNANSQSLLCRFCCFGCLLQAPALRTETCF